MFKEMRRKDRQTDLVKAKEILEKGIYGILSTIGENGYPTGIPFNYANDDDFIYLHSAFGYTYENVKNNEKVCFTVVNNCEVIPDEFVSNYESVVVHGTAEIASDDDKNTGLKAMLKKYSINFLKEGVDHIKEDFNNCIVIKIHIDNITGKMRTGNN